MAEVMNSIWMTAPRHSETGKTTTMNRIADMGFVCIGGIDYRVLLRYADFNPVPIGSGALDEPYPVGEPTVAPLLSADAVPGGSRLFVIQFWTQPLDEYRESLASVGASVVCFLPHNGSGRCRGEPLRHISASSADWVVKQVPAHGRACGIWHSIGKPALRFSKQQLGADPRNAALHDDLGTANWSANGGAPDTLNTVENIFIQSPAPGTWKVKVLLSEKNADGNPETLASDADFALVISGATSIEPMRGGDWDGSGAVDVLDVHAYLRMFFDGRGDCNGDSLTTVSDLFLFLDRFLSDKR